MPYTVMLCPDPKQRLEYCKAHVGKQNPYTMAHINSPVWSVKLDSNLLFVRAAPWFYGATDTRTLFLFSKTPIDGFETITPNSYWDVLSGKAYKYYLQRSKDLATHWYWQQFTDIDVCNAILEQAEALAEPREAGLTQFASDVLSAKCQRFERLKRKEITIVVYEKE